MTAPTTWQGVLRTAADQIETYGLAQQDFFDYSKGPMGADPATVPCCAMGGMRAAVGYTQLIEESQQTPLTPSWQLVYTAEEQFQGWLYSQNVMQGIGNWNDAEERTAEEVVSALRACADAGDAS